MKELEADQLVLLLELLLELDVMAAGTLSALQKQYNLTASNADVRHRWCELVVKHKYYVADGDVEQFLMEDQSMGVYLYGELVLSSRRHRQLARKCFNSLATEMDMNSLNTVKEILANLE